VVEEIAQEKAEAVNPAEEATQQVEAAPEAQPETVNPEVVKEEF
jgi:hypothetical protein